MELGMTEETATYSRVQKAWFPFPVFAAAAVLLLVALGGSGAESVWVWLSVGILVLLLWIVITFSRLSVSVDGDEITAAFGPGWPKKVIPTADVVAAETVRNSWWYGWGIRWLPGGTWMYNVQGLDAVEIERRDDTPFRIGTDDPKGLLQAIRNAM